MQRKPAREEEDESQRAGKQEIILILRIMFSSEREKLNGLQINKIQPYSTSKTHVRFKGTHSYNQRAPHRAQVVILTLHKIKDVKSYHEICVCAHTHAICPWHVTQRLQQVQMHTSTNKHPNIGNRVKGDKTTERSSC